VTARPNHNIGFGRHFKPILNLIGGWVAVGALHLVRLGDRNTVANLLGAMMRTIGPWLPEHRIGRANLEAAFPEKPPAEVERILRGVWDNLGRVAAEFAYLDRIRIGDPNKPGSGDVRYEPAALALLDQIRQSEKPTIFFAAHIGNWEISALVPPLVGLDSYALYRPLSNRVINKAILKIRAGCMGTLVPAGLAAPIQLEDALKRGGHVGMLVDQHFSKGVDVVFFGRTCKANPLSAWLAQRLDCPIRGLRVVRLADRNTFIGELTQPLDLPRGAEGRIDIQGSMQAITSVVEEWIREHPEQWLWLHRRWR
jgi:KDO2-lipid IV(A) lauroyltransferase